VTTDMDQFAAKRDVRLPDDRPRLTVVGPTGARIDFLVVADEVRIGRSKTSDVVLTDATASYSHAVLRRRGAGYEILDLKSRNGVFVNGDRVDSRRALRDGDEVTIGRTGLTFSWPGESDAHADAGDFDDEDDDDVDAPKSSKRLQAAWIAFASRIIAHTLGAAAMIALGLLIAGGMPTGCGLGSDERSDAPSVEREQTVSEILPDSTPRARPAVAPDRPDPSS
jgi:hypothetical protein